MKWSNYDLNWGRPLRSIMAIFDKKHLKFKFAHLESVEFTIVEEDVEIKQKKVRDFQEYLKFLIHNDITLDQDKRAKFISDKIRSICKGRSCREDLDQSLLLEVCNLFFL